jgi:hypothetical protein
MDTKTLDAKLRERGRKELEEAVKAAMPNFRSLSKGSSYSPEWFKTILVDSEEKQPAQLPLSIEYAMDRIRKTLIKELTPTWEQAEVDAFIADVGNLKEQVEELEQRVSE